MAITINTLPLTHGRVYDTNRLMYKMSSTNYTQPNFRFYITLWAATDFNSYVSIATIRKRPLSDGTCFFNPAEIYSNYLTSDLTINISGLTEALNSNLPFRLIVKEEWNGAIQSIGTTCDLHLYNGLQEYIPYDIVAYGGGNAQWMMSGISWTYGWWDRGDWNYEATQMGSGKIMLNYQATAGITGLTNVVVSYTDSDSNNATTLINHISAGDYIKLVGTNVNEWMIFSFGTQVQSSTGTTWNNITYYSKGSAMAMTGFTHKTKVSLYAANTDEIRGYGKYLTDALNYQVDTYDYANLYFYSIYQPAYVRVKVFYWADPVGIGIGDDEEIINNIDMSAYISNFNDLNKAINQSTSSDNSQDTVTSQKAVSAISPIFRPQVSSYYTGYTLSYTTTNNFMFYVPTGPMELNAKGIFNLANSQPGSSGWISYQIDLTDSLAADAKIYNSYPMYYYRKNKCNKYGPIQVFWLNPHGGFDRYTFYKKNYTNYDIERTIWQHRFSDTYQLGERGTTVYKTRTVPTIVLNTDLLTASEAQILSQLESSPEVYTVYEYSGGVYKIPYVVSDTKYQYQDLRNTKVATMEISITPAYKKVSQTS